MNKARKKHILSGLKNKYHGGIYIFIDTETQSTTDISGVEHLTFYLAVSRLIVLDKDLEIKYDEVKRHDNLDTLWQYINDLVVKYKRVTIYTHNADFDFQIMDSLRYTQKMGYELENFIVDNFSFAFTWRKNKAHLTFADSVMILRTSIKNLGNLLNLPKLEMPSTQAGDKETMYIYCQRDVDILTQSMLNYFHFVKEHDYGNIMLTLPSQAFAAYRRKYMQHEIIIHANDNADDAEIKAYYGGRTEAFYIGEVKDIELYYLDVNSLYPYVMRANLYPWRLIGHKQHLSITEAKQLLARFGLVARMHVNMSEPALPYRANKLIFPVGHWSGYYTTPEIQYAIDTHQVDKIEDVYVYEMADLFSQYIDDLYRLKAHYKAEGNKVYYYLVKLMLNGLGGKFGQRTAPYAKVGRDIVNVNRIIRYYDPASEELSYTININGDVYERGERQVSANSFVAISAHMTAYARQYMWHLMKLAGLDNLYYMDTDSLIVNETGYKTLHNYIDAYELGKLKIEKRPLALIIRGAKDYTIDGEEVRKGVKVGSLKLDDNTYMIKQFSRIKTNLTNGIQGEIQIMPRRKILTCIYDKGIITSGGHIRPLEIDVD